MKYKDIASLRPGAALHLKPERAARYGLPDRLVHFDKVDPNVPPHGACVLASGGAYRPGDFARHVPQQDDK